MFQNLNIWGVMDESDTNDADCCRKVVRGRKGVGAIRSLFNARC